MGLSSLIKDGACAPSIGSTEMPEKSHYFKKLVKIHIFPGGSDGKASAYNVGDLGSIPGSGRSPGEGYGNPLQYSCLENPMDGGTWLGYSPRGCKESDTTERLHSLILLSIDISKSKLHHINISKSLNLLLNLHFMEINL